MARKSRNSGVETAAHSVTVSLDTGGPDLVVFSYSLDRFARALALVELSEAAIREVRLMHPFVFSRARSITVELPRG